MNYFPRKIFIRKEIKKNEYRTPLTPTDCRYLISKGFKIFVESSDKRCFSDKEYMNNGCIIQNYYREGLIIGLKEFDYDDDFMFKKNHLYFAHCYKNQENARFILGSFKKNGGEILDYEYLVDQNGKRLIAFGFWAGFVGTALALKQYYQKINTLPDIHNLEPIYDYNILLQELKDIDLKNISIGIIGINGRCGTGARFLLDKLNIPFTGYTKNNSLNNLINHDIIVNCIFLSQHFNKTFISMDNLHKFKKLKVISDVSCDITAKNNPIKLNYKLTSFKDPIYHINENIDIICIDNLPSLLPKDSSNEFSKKLTELILDDSIWNNLLQLFYKKINDL